MEIIQFLSELYKGAERGLVSIWTKTDKKTAWFAVSELEKIAEHAIKTGSTTDIYYGVALRDKKLGDYERGKNEDVSCITALWADIDIKGPAHKQTELPETIDDAIGFLNSLEFKPSVLVNSGNGLHAYWLLDEPIYIATPQHRNNVSELLTGFQRHINTLALKEGWKLDNTSDLARVLRLPGTWNYKSDERKACEVLSFNNDRYTPEQFSKYKAQTKPQEKAEDRADCKGILTGGGGKCIDNCVFMQHCRDNAKDLPEPYWHAMVTNLSLASDGVGLCHDLSKGYQKYNENETENKAQRARRERKPHTCKYINETLNFDCGRECAVKSPIGHSVISKADQVKEVLKGEVSTVADVYADEMIDALAYAKERLGKEYALFKANVKQKIKSINLLDLDRAINQYIKEKKADSGKDGQPIELEGVELAGIICPSSFLVDEGGVKKIITSGDGVKVAHISPIPVLVTKRLINIDDDTEKTELSFKLDGRWKQVIGSRSKVFNKNSILSFSDDGLRVSTGNAPDMVNYLESYDSVNINTIPKVKSIDRLGWVGARLFFPYITDDEILYEPDSESHEIFRNLKAEGDYALWRDTLKELRKNPLARFIVSASFASPLLEKLRMRNFVIHIWATSKSGKTAALKAAISIWGNPNNLIGSFFATKAGLEQMAAALRNLPYAIDEKQVNDDRKMDIENLIYMLGQGVGKVRGAKGGGNQKQLSWNNIIITTGEEPVSKHNSKDGSITRTIEITGIPIENEDFAKAIHKLTSQSYGHAGAEYIRYVCGILKADQGRLIKDYDNLLAKLKERGVYGVHADYCAAVALGDMYAEISIWNKPEIDAESEALELAALIHENAKLQHKGSVVDRAYEFITGWIVSNRNRFESDATPCYGKVEKGVYSVIPSYLDSALIEAGYNVDQVIKGLRESNRILVYVDSSGKRRTTRRVTINYTLVSCYQFEIVCNDESPKPL